MKTRLLSGHDAAAKLSAMIVAAIFFILIALQAYVFWKSLQQIEVQPAVKTASTHQTSQDAPNIGKLAATHLFGDTQKTTPQDSEVKEDKSLNLTLRGIVANSGGKTSLAIIESKPGGEETFAPGDSVFNKGKLNFIAVDYVILMRNDGGLARLQLPEPESIDLGNEEYLPQPQPEYVEPENVAPTSSNEPEAASPEQASDNGTTTEPAATAHESQPENQTQPETQPESSPDTAPDKPAGDDQNATPAQP